MKPRIIAKAFHYANHLHWKMSRLATVSAEGKPALTLSSPVEFKGEPGNWTPEDLFLVSLNSCLLMTFLAYAERENIAVSSYESAVSGTVEKDGNGYRFTEVHIEPRVGLEDSSYAGRVEELLHHAEETCLIANSVKARVHVEPHVLAIAD